MQPEDSQDPPSNLGKIQTHVSKIERAFGKAEKSGEQAQEQENYLAESMEQIMRDREAFIKLYQPAAMSYIRGVLVRISSTNSPSLADDVGAIWSNLVTRLLEGNFSSFKHTGKQGSFRAWLRRVIANECKQHQRAHAHTLGKKGPKHAVPLNDEVDPETVDAEDRSLEQALRKTVIQRAYEALEDDGLNGVAVLFSAQRGGAFTSQELADHLSAKSGKTFSADAAKKRLQRGRELFAQNLLEQVALLDGTDDLDRIEETLVELDLMGNCRKALAARRESKG